MVIQSTIPSAIYSVVVQDTPSLKYSESVLLDKYKIFRSKVPTSTVVESFNTVDVITTNYQVGAKTFIAVVQYDKTTQENTKILEVNPIDLTTPLTFDQTVVDGKTITISNSVDEIQAENGQTKNVLVKILSEYPLLKKYNITEVTLTESDYSNLFEVTYTNPVTSQETTVTVRTDLEGKQITIDDIEITQPTDLITSIPVIPTLVYQQEEFASVAVQKIVTVVNTKLPVDTITNVVSETYPQYVLSKLTVVSAGLPYEVTVI